MPSFALVKEIGLNDVVAIYYLSVDNRNLYDEFCNSLETKDKSKVYGKVYATLEALSQNKKVPQHKFKQLKRPKGDEIADFEIKIDRFRVYLFKYKGFVVVVGSDKGNQNKEISRFRKLKIDFIKSQNIG